MFYICTVCVNKDSEHFYSNVIKPPPPPLKFITIMGPAPAYLHPYTTDLHSILLSFPILIILLYLVMHNFESVIHLQK